MTDLNQYLSSPAGYKYLVDSFNTYLWTQQFTELDTYICAHLKQVDSPIAKLCLSVPLGSVHFNPNEWKTLQRDLIKTSEGSTKISAIGVDLTGHWDPPGPGFEVSFYEDEVDEGFIISKHSRQALIEASEYPPPWQAYFQRSISMGLIRGLEPVYDALNANRNDLDWSPPRPDAGYDSPIPDDFVAKFLGLYSLHNHVHETFARELASYGLPYSMPVLLGTHDFMGFDVYNVLMSTYVPPNLPSYASIIEDDAQHVKKHTVKKIAEMTKTWVYIRAGQLSTGELSMAHHLKLNGCSIPKPISQMSLNEFKSLMETYYKAKVG